MSDNVNSLLSIMLDKQFNYIIKFSSLLKLLLFMLYKILANAISSIILAPLLLHKVFWMNFFIYHCINYLSREKITLYFNYYFESFVLIFHILELCYLNFSKYYDRIAWVFPRLQANVMIFVHFKKILRFSYTHYESFLF